MAKQFNFQLSTFNFLLLLAFLLFPCVSASAQQAQEADTKVKTMDVYALGYATVLGDSTIYLTEIQLLPKAQLTEKYEFLVGRSEYSVQLRSFLQTAGIAHPTCLVLYDKDKAKLMKTMTKLLAKERKTQNRLFKTISAAEFTFKEL